LCLLFVARLARYRSGEETGMRKSILTILAITIVVSLPMAQMQDVPYPEGYRDWRHVKSMVISEGHPLYNAFGGIHHLYANELALKGYATSKFPDGAVIVFDRMEAVVKDHAIAEGSRKVLGVMHKDAKQWSATGGWGFEGFAGDSKTERVVGKEAAARCFACHEGQRAKDYVFSAAR
jgi:Cytochrome P460